MKIILARDGVKREIETPFSMFVPNLDDLDRLIVDLRKTRAAIAEVGWRGGWFLVGEGPDAPSGPPLPWVTPYVWPPESK